MTTPRKDIVPLGKVALKRQRRKEEILQLALSQVAEGGLEALTIHGLAKELGLTPGALYRYFKSKAAILSALERQALETVLIRLEGRLGQLPESCGTHRDLLLPLLAAGEVYLRMPAEDPEVARLISALLGDPRRLITTEDLPEVGRVFIALFGRLIDLFEQAERGGALSTGNARQRALIFWSGLQGITQLDKMSRVAPGFFDIPTMGMELCRSLLRGWGADPDLLHSISLDDIVDPLATSQTSQP